MKIPLMYVTDAIHSQACTNQNVKLKLLNSFFYAIYHFQNELFSFFLFCFFKHKTASKLVTAMSIN